MKNSLFKVFILIIIEIAIFWIFSRFLNFPFALAFLQSMVYSLLCGALILEARSKRNSSFWIFAILNFIFLFVLLFLVPNPAYIDQSKITESEYQSIHLLRKQTTPYYSKDEKIRIAKVFYFLSSKKYDKALDNIQPIISKNDFTQRLHSYILREKAHDDSQYEKALKEIPYFKEVYKLFLEENYIGFIERLNGFNDKEVAHYYINLAKRRMTLLTNDSYMEGLRAYEVKQFLKEYHSEDSLKHILFISPSVQKYYSSMIAQYESQGFSYYDFQNFENNYEDDYREINAISNAICFAKKEDSQNTYIIRSNKIVFGKNLYPLFAFNLTLSSDDNQIIHIPLAKITTHDIVYYDQQKIEKIHLPKIYFKIRNSKELLQNPLSISWLSLYKEDLPETYQIMIKPYWKEFWKLLFSIALALVVCYFLVAYFKEGVLQKVSYYYYFLPFIFLIPASLLLTNLIVKASNFIFKIL